MNWKLDKKRAICPQIEEQICVGIALGELSPNEKLSSVRDLAVTASVNPNTVQKAFEGLESKGILCSVRGSGWFVSENTETAKLTVEAIIKTKTDEYIKAMEYLGQSPEQIINLIKEKE